MFRGDVDFLLRICWASGVTGVGGGGCVGVTGVLDGGENGLDDVEEVFWYKYLL